MAHAVEHGAPPLEIADQVAQRLARPCLQFVRLERAPRRLEQRDLLGALDQAQRAQGRFAQAPARRIVDSLEGEIVVVLDGDAAIGQRVADFLALVEARAADHAIGQAHGDEAFLELAGLEAGPHQDGDLRELVLVALQSLDLLADGAGFLVAVPDAAQRDALALLGVGPQRLSEAALIVRDEVRRRGQDVRCRTVVTLQPHDGGVGEVLFEAQDVADLGAAPAVDRLVVVADAAHILGALRQQSQPEILGDVGVLVLVHQDVAEAPMIDRQDIRMLLPQGHAVHHQIAEIDRVHLGQTLLVLAVDVGRAAVGEFAGIVARDLFRRQRAVLPALDDAGQDARRPFLVVDPLRLQELLDQPRLVVGVQNGEIALEPDQLGMAAQHAYADGVEGAEPHAVGRAADQARHAVEHFARGLVREGYGQDLRGPGLTGQQQMGDAGRQNAGFAGSGAGQDQQGAARVRDGLPLLGIQPVEMRRGRDGAPRRDRIGRSGVIGDFERIGGGRHGPSYSNRGGGRLSLRLWTRLVRAEVCGWPEG